MALVIAGERSGVGKTTVTLTLLASLCQRSTQVQSFKVGPDYIDPMFHQHVTGRPSRNLDPVLTSEEYIKQCFTYNSQVCEYTLIEGVMGLFDGVTPPQPLTFLRGGANDFASTAHIARLLNLPVVLVIDCSRLSGSVAAIAHGYCSFDQEIKIAGVVLNRVGSDRHLSLLKDALEPLQLPILGVLRREENITIPDRHLGLVPTAELPQLQALIDRLAHLGNTCFDWERLLPLLQTRGAGEQGSRGAGEQRSRGAEEQGRSSLPIFSPTPVRVRIAVARDRAFNFYYQDNLDLLQQLGAELVFWSPLEDPGLPQDVQGMYFGGGFPEVFAQQLAQNSTTRDAVKTAILSGMPTIAECGGLMYLCEEIVDFEEKSWSMVGVLPTTAVMGGRLTLGYRRAVALQDGLLVPAGTTVYGHEFHRSRLIPTPNSPLFQTYRYDCEESTGYEGWNLLPSLHASYIHQHWGESLDIPKRFLQKCCVFKFT
ncbi:cobyrinate a,c-diamide synthase [Brasilonema bromeliae]|uniref:Cobyrinate a,c-diamide synthase n=1 Tax=Brasilonema bromeliae SPC951 TaxID=385972 RepID=A0ABX1PDV2_9CYAN|nr:cobyrinate a,c-diamide synthase [Brasilonema bromeliae]NMG22674.1 cobyrinic acid a,c-diamide synthase [Brasilonema bromeliae SPC951]